MIKKLIEITALSVLVVGLIYLLNNMGPVGADAKTALKYLWFGLLGIMAVSIISVTIIALAAIIFGIGWLKGLTAGGGRPFPGGGRRDWGNMFKVGDFVRQKVEDSVREAFDSDSGNMLSREISQEYDFYGFDNFKVKTANGDIKISGYEGTKIKISAEIFEKSEKDASPYIENGELKLKTLSGKKAFFGDISVQLPSQIAEIYLETVNGDMQISELSFSKNGVFKGINGDIIFEKVKNSAQISIKTVAGDISFKTSVLDCVSAQTVSGDIKAQESVAQKASFKTVSGDIDCKGSEIKELLTETVSGEVIR